MSKETLSLNEVDHLIRVLYRLRDRIEDEKSNSKTEIDRILEERIRKGALITKSEMEIYFG